MQYSVAASGIDKTPHCPFGAAGSMGEGGGGAPNVQNNKILCGFFCWTPVKRSESNFSDNDNYHYNYNYKGPEYQVAVPPVAVYAACYTCSY